MKELGQGPARLNVKDRVAHVLFPLMNALFVKKLTWKIYKTVNFQLLFRRPFCFVLSLHFPKLHATPNGCAWAHTDRFCIEYWYVLIALHINKRPCKLALQTLCFTTLYYVYVTHFNMALWPPLNQSEWINCPNNFSTFLFSSDFPNFRQTNFIVFSANLTWLYLVHKKFKILLSTKIFLSLHLRSKLIWKHAVHKTVKQNRLTFRKPFYLKGALGTELTQLAQIFGAYTVSREWWSKYRIRR